MSVEMDMREFIVCLEEMPATLLSSPELPPGMSYSEEDNAPYFFLQKAYLEEKVKVQGNLGRSLLKCPYDEMQQVWDKHFESHVLDCREEWKKTVNQVEGDSSLILTTTTCEYDWRHRIYVKEANLHTKACPSRCHLTRTIVETEFGDGVHKHVIDDMKTGVPWGYKDNLPSIWKVNKTNEPPQEEEYVTYAMMEGPSEGNPVTSILIRTFVWVPGTGRFVQTKEVRHRKGDWMTWNPPPPPPPGPPDSSSSSSASSSEEGYDGQDEVADSSSEDDFFPRPG